MAKTRKVISEILACALAITTPLASLQAKDAPQTARSQLAAGLKFTTLQAIDACLQIFGRRVQEIEKRIPARNDQFVSEVQDLQAEMPAPSGTGVISCMRYVTTEDRNGKREVIYPAGCEVRYTPPQDENSPPIDWTFIIRSGRTSAAGIPDLTASFDGDREASVLFRKPGSSREETGATIIDNDSNIADVLDPSTRQKKDAVLYITSSHRIPNGISIEEPQEADRSALGRRLFLVHKTCGQ